MTWLSSGHSTCSTACPMANAFRPCRWSGGAVLIGFSPHSDACRRSEPDRRRRIAGNRAAAAKLAIRTAQRRAA